MSEKTCMDKVGVGSKLCYAIGFAGKDSFTTIVNSYLMLFLMMVAGLDGVFIGIMMLIARIWDAFTDPMLGSIADHTNSRLGKFRPYILSVVPMAIIFVALFFSPDFSMRGKMIYYTVVYVLAGTPVYCALLLVCYLSGKVSVSMYLTALVALNLFTGILQINIINLCFEVCDLLEHKNGVRSDATVFAVVSFLMKLAAGLGATIAGWGLRLMGFQGMGPVMIEVTPAMADGVAVLRFALPGGLAALAFLAVCFYPITKKQIISVHEELEERHNASTK